MSGPAHALAAMPSNAQDVLLQFKLVCQAAAGDVYIASSSHHGNNMVQGQSCAFNAVQLALCIECLSWLTYWIMLCVQALVDLHFVVIAYPSLPRINQMLTV